VVLAVGMALKVGQIAEALCGASTDSDERPILPHQRRDIWPVPRHRSKGHDGLPKRGGSHSVASGDVERAGLIDLGQERQMRVVLGCATGWQLWQRDTCPTPTSRRFCGWQDKDTRKFKEPMHSNHAQREWLLAVRSLLVARPSMARQGRRCSPPHAAERLRSGAHPVACRLPFVQWPDNQIRILPGCSPTNCRARVASHGQSRSLKPRSL
jgi:hypothetical protein